MSLENYGNRCQTTKCCKQWAQHSISAFLICSLSTSRLHKCNLLILDIEHLYNLIDKWADIAPGFSLSSSMLFHIWNAVNFCGTNLQSRLINQLICISRDWRDSERATRVCSSSLRGRRRSQSLQDRPVMVGNPAGVGVCGIGGGGTKKEKGGKQSGVSLWSIKKTTWVWKYFWHLCPLAGLKGRDSLLFNAAKYEDGWQESPR